MNAGTEEIGPLVTQANYVDLAFGKGGYLAQGKADYSPRPGQIAFARAVDRAIVNRGHLVCEAPTGTGKSLAYAIPASFHVWRRRQAGEKEVRAILVTANNALSEQLTKKDLPFLQKILPWPFSFGLLKGRAQYLCLSKYLKREGEAWANRTDQSFTDRRRLQILQEWAKATVAGGKDEEEGDVSELPFEDGALWSQFSVSSDECRGQKCRNARDCFALAAQARAKSADLIVTNYHMLLIDILIRQHTQGEAYVLPPSDMLILDEAHALSAIARDAFGWRMTREALRKAARSVSADNKSLEDDIEKSSRIFFDLMRSYRKDFKRYKGFVDDDLFPHEKTAGDQMFKIVEEIHEAMATRSERLFSLAGGAYSDPRELTGRELEFFEEATDLERGAERIRLHLQNLDQFLNPWAQNGTQAFFIEADDKDRPWPSSARRTSLCSKLVHPRDALGPTLFSLSAADDDPFSDLPSKPSPTKTVVLTSATLSLGKNDFSYVAYDLGIPKGYAELTVESPFDWKKQACLIVPSGLPAPDNKEWKGEVVDILKKTIALAGGRTLGLFTSYAMLNLAYDELLLFCRQRDIRLFRQKDAPRTKLIEDFKNDVSSCLFGTESFWAGVDVPGDALSVVVIDKLPFPTRDDPVLGALSKVDKRWFQNYSVPSAIIKTKQAFGRLIRATTDRGVVVLCDNRILEKGYGKQFLRALPPVELRRNISDLTQWVSSS